MTPVEVTARERLGEVSGIAHEYAGKGDRYFANARKDYVDELPRSDSARVLEVGCGAGGTGAYALSQGKCAEYCGVELFGPAAATAASRLTEVVCGDVERVDLPWASQSFEALIMSEVLEHLRDPAATLSRLRGLLKPGARVFASVPNVAHYSVIRMLLRGRWDLADSGTMDRTHLRWFTPSSFAAMFIAAGFSVDSVAPIVRPSARVRLLTAAAFGAGSHLFWRQISLRGRVP